MKKYILLFLALLFGLTQNVNAATKPKIKECGKNGNCFVKAIISCSPSQITTKESIDTKMGAVLNSVIKQTVKPKNANTCLYNLKYVKLDFKFNDALLRKKVSTSTAMISSFKKYMKDGYGYGGTEFTCEYDPNNLKNLGTKNLAALGMAISGSYENCTGTYKAYLQKKVEEQKMRIKDRMKSSTNTLVGSPINTSTR